MNKILSSFLDRVAERLAALAAGLVTSRVEGLHATVQAEQLSELEDLARQYEADGKLEIAASLRKRLLRMGSPDLASEAVEVLQRVTAEPAQLSGPSASVDGQDLRGLPNFAASGPRVKKKPRNPSENSLPISDLEAGL